MATETQDSAQELQSVLQVVGVHLPALLRQVRESLFSEDAGRDMGKAVAAFYKELMDAGVPTEHALTLTQGYLAHLNVGGNLNFPDVK